MLEEFVSAYGTEIIFTVLTAVASFIGLQIKKLYEKYVNDKTKKEVVENTVKYVEQLYKSLDGAEKLEKAKESIVALLNEKGLTITELEMDVLIEATCNSFKEHFKTEEESEG